MELFSERKSFKDRKDAALKLAKALEQFKDKNALVLGIPKGGVEVAFHVAKHLNAELSVAITKKLPYPNQEELSFGALGEDGSIYVAERIGNEVGRLQLEKIIEKQRIEIEKKVKMYRRGNPIPEMRERIVILIDDGMATAPSFVPAIEMCRRRGASKVVVAAPVGEQTRPAVLKKADEFVVLENPDIFYSVGQVYEEFPTLDDKAVGDFLRKAEEWKKQ
jgi:predicted phosphoribosyltransferase